MRTKRYGSYETYWDDWNKLVYVIEPDPSSDVCDPFTGDELAVDAKSAGLSAHGADWNALVADLTRQGYELIEDELGGLPLEVGLARDGRAVISFGVGPGAGPDLDPLELDAAMRELAERVGITLY